jgi:hypothetical protein
MITIRSEVFLLLLVCTGLTGTVVAQTGEAPVKPPTGPQTSNVNNQAGKRITPLVTECSPQAGSINLVVELKGLRLGAGERESAKVKAFFIQNGLEIPAGLDSGSWTTNDILNGPQTLEVIVPEEVVPGPARIVVERNGIRSAPVSFKVTPWILPVIKEITPKSGPPGTVVNIKCDNLHTTDEIELTDGEGRIVGTFEGADSPDGADLVIPEDFPEGVFRIRISNPKHGNNQFTAPVEFVVTNEALPIELKPEWIQSVAPGQWIALQAASLEPLEYSEQTEVSFKQAGRSIIVTAPKPMRPHFEVPAALSSGDVQVQVRTWRKGRPSLWSTPVMLQLAEKPLPPSVNGLRLEKKDHDRWVHLWPGPDRAKQFNAAAGDLIVMNGLFPVAGANKLKVLLVREGESVELSAIELNEDTGWFGNLSLKLPGNIGSGDWQMIVRAVDDRTEHQVPIPIRIAPK